MSALSDAVATLTTNVAALNTAVTSAVATLGNVATPDEVAAVTSAAGAVASATTALNAAVAPPAAPAA